MAKSKKVPRNKRPWDFRTREGRKTKLRMKLDGILQQLESLAEELKQLRNSL